MMLGFFGSKAAEEALDGVWSSFQVLPASLLMTSPRAPVAAMTREGSLGATATE